MSRGPMPEFERALSELPASVLHNTLAGNTLDDLRWACLIQLDLIEECQDGTEYEDSRAIRRWLQKYGRPRGA